MRVSIVTVSDSCFAGTRIDESGPKLRELLISSSKINLLDSPPLIHIVPDEIDQIVNILKEQKDAGYDVIITTGGTGFAKRDVTPEATLKLIDRRCTGLEVAIHTHSLKMTPMAALSRSIAGISENTLIINMPGSVKAVKECWEVIEPILKHGVDLLKNSDNGDFHK